MPVWIPMLMAVLGTAMQKRQIKSAGKRRTEEARIGREKKRGVEEEQRTDVLEKADDFDPNVRQENLDTKAVENQDRIEAVLADNEFSTTGDAGEISDKLLLQRAASSRGKANNASIMAALNAKTQAPSDVAVDESEGLFDLNQNTAGRSHQLGRIGASTGVLADLEGQTNNGAMMLASIIQSMGLSGASASIMGGLQSPSTPPAFSGTPQATPVPNYRAPDAFNVRGIK